jgi:hypothetical protein
MHACHAPLMDAAMHAMMQRMHAIMHERMHCITALPG